MYYKVALNDKGGVRLEESVSKGPGSQYRNEIPLYGCYAGAAKAGVDSNGVKIIAGNDDDASVTASVLDNKIKDDITALFNKIKKK